MSSIHVRVGEIAPQSIPVYGRVPRQSEQIASGATSAQSTITARQGEYITVTAIGSDVSVLVGSNPTAIASGQGCEVIMTGQTKDFGPAKEGDKVAVIDLTAS